MPAEFDHYIQNYRSNLDNHLSLSGESSTYFAQYKAQKLHEWLDGKVTPTATILDFGCGDGLMTHFVAQQFSQATCYGIDPSADSITVAQHNYPHITFAVNSETHTHLPYADAFFDIIFAAGAFHHIPFSLHAGYLTELKRICKPNGYIVLFELNPLNPLTVYTFKHNPIDQNARMLKPWYAKRLCHHVIKNKNIQLLYYCFFPNALRFLRPLEKYMTWLPLSALYAVVIHLDE